MRSSPKRNSIGYFPIEAYKKGIDMKEDKCAWCQDGGAMEKYHDEEWGIPLHDDQKQFEFLMLEAMQCGLSWTLMIKKREIFRTCFDNFDYQKIIAYEDDDISRIMNYPGMIRSERKIKAIVNNARRFSEIIREFGSFDSYLWNFTEGKTLVYNRNKYPVPVSSELSDRISADIKKRGFKYLGTVTVYSHLQACGIINDHDPKCERYSYICKNYPCKYID